MAGKNDKWLMFRNYMINELGITKEDIREWINDAVRIEAKKIVDETFARENPEMMIKRIVYDSGYFNKGFSRGITEKAAEILAERLSITVKKD